MLESSLLLCIIIVFIVIIGFPLGAMLNGTYDIQQTNENVKSLPFGMLGLMLWVSIILSLHWIFSFDLQKANILYNYRYQLLFIFFLLVFSSIFYGKRQLLMIMFFFFSLLYILRIKNYLHAIKIFGVLIFSFLLFFSLYVVLQYIRTGGSGDGKGELFFFELVLSALWPIMNLGVVVQQEIISYELNGMISQIIPNRLFGHGVEHIKPLLFEATASINYIQYAYMDFGVYGVFFSSVLFAWVCRFLSVLKVGFVAKYSIRFLIIWCCATASVYSHGFSTNYFLFPVLILLVQDKIFGWKPVYLKTLKEKYGR